MPFQSEKQRRYLWANEPKIAREWTDRYGAADGGITRIGFRRGNPHSDGGGWSPGVSHSGSPSKSTPSHSRSNDGPAHLSHNAPTPYQDRIQRIAAQNKRTAAQNKRTADLRNRASRDGYHQFLTPRDQIAKKTLGMRLGDMGRGLGNLLQFINPLTLATGFIDNPLVRTGITGFLNKNNIFRNKYNNQNVNDFNNLGLYTDRINEKYEDEGRIGDYWREGIETVDTDIRPESRPLNINEVFDDRTLMAGNYSQNAVANQMLGVNYDLLDPFQQHQIDDAINTYGTTSLGTIKT